MSAVRYNRRVSSMSNAKKRRSFFSFLTPKYKKHTRHVVVSQKSFRNPYFLKDRIPKRTRAPRLKIGIGIAALLGIVGIFLFHPYFNIDQINVSGLQQTSLSEINGLVNQVLNTKRFLLFNNKNIFIIDTKNIENTIKQRYSLERIKISKKIPQTLNVEIKEKQPRLVLETPSQNYFVDSEGKVIQKTDRSFDDLFSSIPHFQVVTSGTFKIDDQVIPVATEEFLTYLFNNLSKKAQVSLSNAILADEEGRVVNLVTTEGWKIIVDRQADWDKQIQVLAIILRDKIKDNRSKLHYIDVRYENRSYFQ